MTRKHFNSIADYIYFTLQDDTYYTKRQVAEHLATAIRLSRVNDRFNSTRFCEACLQGRPSVRKPKRTRRAA